MLSKSHVFGTICQLCAWLVWLGLMALALAIAAYSVWLSWTAANQWFDTQPANLELRPLGVAGVDLAKAILMCVIAVLVRRRRRLLAIALSVVLAVATLASIQASYSVFATGRITVLGQRQATIERRRGLLEMLGGLRTELAPNDGLPPPAAVRAAMRALEFDHRWQTSKGCTDATASASRRLCAEHAKLFARLAGSNRAAELRRKIDETRQEIRKLTTGETVAGPAPELAAIARHVGLTIRGVVELRAFAIAMLIEVLSVTLIAAAWRVRPWLSDQRDPILMMVQRVSGLQHRRRRLRRPSTASQVVGGKLGTIRNRRARRPISVDLLNRQERFSPRRPKTLQDPLKHRATNRPNLATRIRVTAARLNGCRAKPLNG